MDLKRILPSIPCVRPHYRIQGHQLFFLISRRPTLDLSEDDLLLFNRIDGVKTVAEIAQGDATAIERIRRWFDADILELIPPIDRGSMPHVVVIEPHMDDAILSVGGQLLHDRGRSRITILSAVRFSNFTSYWQLHRDFLDVGVVTSLRLGESALAARLLGVEHRCLDWTDAPIRFLPAEEWSVENLKRILPAVYSFLEISPDPKEIATLKEKLRRELELLGPDEIWFPMGLGHHVDHRTVRSACVAMLAEATGPLAKASIRMYEDLPYNKSEHALQIQKAFEKQGAKIMRCTEDITDVFDEKLHVLSIFASQFKRSYMEPLIRRCAENTEPGVQGRFKEVYYHIQGRIAMPCESSLAPNRPVLEGCRRRARALFEKRMQYQYLTVVAAPAANLGRWRADCERLLTIFPIRHIRLYSLPAMDWQTRGPVPDRTSVRVLRKGFAEWIWVMVKALSQSRALMVILWWGAGRENRGWKGRFLETLAFFSRNIVLAQSLGDLCMLLEEENRGTAEVRCGGSRNNEVVDPL